MLPANQTIPQTTTKVIRFKLDPENFDIINGYINDFTRQYLGMVKEEQPELKPMRAASVARNRAFDKVAKVLIDPECTSEQLKHYYMSCLGSMRKKKRNGTKTKDWNKHSAKEMASFTLITTETAMEETEESLYGALSLQLRMLPIGRVAVVEFDSENSATYAQNLLGRIASDIGWTNRKRPSDSLMNKRIGKKLWVVRIQ